MLKMMTILELKVIKKKLQKKSMRYISVHHMRN